MPNNPAPILSYQLSLLDTLDVKLLRDTWILPPQLISQLERHYLLYWEKAFLADNDGLADGTVLEHQSRKYITILLEPLTAFETCARVALSFRHPKGTKFGYCLIKPALKRNEH